MLADDKRKIKQSTSIVVFSALIVLVGLGIVLDSFSIQVLTEALIMSLFAMSFALLYGHTGLLSFGQGAYFAVGAYGFALALTKLQLSFFPCIFIGIVVAGVWAWIMGYLCVRLSGIYFAIMTVVVTQSTFYILFQWYSVTGGDNGIQGLLPPEFLTNPRIYYMFVIVVVGLASAVFYLIVNSPFGLSLKCIRENAVRSSFVGVRVRAHMHKAFILAGLFAGLAGILYCVHTRHVVPQMANWQSSGNAVFMGILGGAASPLGPFLGSLLWVPLDAFVSGFTERWPLIIGLILFLITYFAPGGLMGIVSLYLARRRRHKLVSVQD
jgi:branched-chain amino acid transport system permease protein